MGAIQNKDVVLTTQPYRNLHYKAPIPFQLASGPDLDARSLSYLFAVRRDLSRLHCVYGCRPKEGPRDGRETWHADHVLWVYEALTHLPLY